MAALFDSQITVAELLHRWPQTLPVFFRLHTQCVGCLMAAFDTLEDVAVNYRLPVADLMDELTNAAASQTET